MQPADAPALAAERVADPSARRAPACAGPAHAGARRADGDAHGATLTHKHDVLVRLITPYGSLRSSTTVWAQLTAITTVRYSEPWLLRTVQQ